MAFSELRGVNRDLYLKKQIEELKAVYKAEQKKLIRLLAQADVSSFSQMRAKSILAQVDQIVEALNNRAYKWAKNSLPDSYMRGFDWAAERLRSLGVARYASPAALVHTQAINVLIDDVTAQILQANTGVKTSFNRFIQRTQQRLLEDKQISRLIAQGQVEGATRRTVSDSILKDLRSKMQSEKFITINGRSYDPASYAEMVARSRTREATTQGTINTALRYGVDLVQWDVHAHVCTYCQQFAGRVYSLSGADKDFPQLDERPPAHPNCECVLSPITRRTLERRGVYDSIVKLSNSPSIEVSSFSRFEELLETI